MQHYEVEVGGRLRRIGIAKSGDGDRFAVTIDDRPMQVDVARSGAHTMSLVCHTGRAYEVVVAPDPVSPSQFIVTVGTVPVPVTVNGRRRWGRKDLHGGVASGPQRITAPMPGKVVRVLVKTGDAVRVRQPLVVVEAMKMENELRAGREGKVAEVHAREGESVEAGALLVVIQ